MFDSSTDGNAARAAPAQPEGSSSTAIETNIDCERACPGSEAANDTTLPVCVETPKRSRGYTTVPTEDDSGHSSAISSVDTSVGANGEKTDHKLRRLHILGTWTPEFLALFLSFLSFSAMVAILGTYHTKQQPAFTYSFISINTFIAICSTVLRATLLYITAETIGQSKWWWMKNPRPLRHIEGFDNASKGAWGSLKFLFVIHELKMASVGAIIIIASYVIGPFSQQAVTTYSCDIPVKGAAKIHVVEHVGLRTRTLSMIDPEMNVAAISGLMYGADYLSLGTSKMFECDSGNCTFDTRDDITHASIGMCSSCINAATSLKSFDRGKNGTEYRFTENTNSAITWPAWPAPPEKYFFSGYRTYSLTMEFPLDVERKSYSNGTYDDREEMVVSIVAFTRRPLGHDEPDTLEAQQYHQTKENTSHPVGTILGGDVRVVAANCSIYPCLRYYNAKVVNGVLNEKLVSQDPMDIAIVDWGYERGEFPGFMKFIEPCIIQGGWYDISNISKAPRDGIWKTWETKHGLVELPSECMRTMSYWTMVAMREFLNETLIGSCPFLMDKLQLDASYLPSGGLKLEFKDILDWVSCERWWVAAVHKAGNLTFEDITAAFDGMATAMTNYLRSTYGLNRMNWTTGDYLPDDPPLRQWLGEPSRDLHPRRLAMALLPRGATLSDDSRTHNDKHTESLG